MTVLTVPEVKSALNITGVQWDNTVLPTYIAAAERALARWVGPLEPTTVTEHLTGPSLVLSTLPVISVTSITAITAGAVAVNQVGIDVNPDSGVVLWPSFSPLTCQRYVVVYQAGRAAGQLPDNLHQAAIEMVRKLVDTFGPGSERPKVGQRQREVKMSDDPPAVVAMLIKDDRPPGFSG